MEWKMDLEGYTIDIGFCVSNIIVNPVTTGN